MSYTLAKSAEFESCVIIRVCCVSWAVVDLRLDQRQHDLYVWHVCVYCVLVEPSPQCALVLKWIQCVEVYLEHTRRTTHL